MSKQCSLGFGLQFEDLYAREGLLRIGRQVERVFQHRALPRQIGRARSVRDAQQSLGGKLGAAAKGPPAGPGGHSLPTDAAAFPCGY